MDPAQTITAIAAACQLALALLAIARGKQSPLATPLALLCLDIFGWNGATLAHDLSGDLAWTVIDHALAPLTAPLALHFTLVFVGRRRSLAPALYASYALAALLSLVAVAALFDERARAMIHGSAAWGTCLAAIALPAMGFSLALLAVHLARPSDEAERSRTRLLLIALGIGTLLGSTEMLEDLGLPVPGLSSLGMLASTVPMAVVALRFRLFAEDVSIRVLNVALAFGVVAAAAPLIALRFAEVRIAIALFGSVLIAAGIVAVGRRAFVDSALEKERTAQLTRLGRFSAQMAHDLKNPLAALKGAAQLIRGDLAAPAPAIDRAAFIDLMLAQIERMSRVIDTYGRLSRIELDRRPLQPNELVGQVLALQTLAPPPGVTVRAELARELPPISADRDLLASALENLVKNAIEATPKGEIVVGTHQDEAAIVVEVRDTGAGMDARTREQAFDDFFTTKASGSGLGLAFVRRVIAAHGGEVVLQSVEGRGTVVAVRLPRDPADEARR